MTPPSRLFKFATVAKMKSGVGFYFCDQSQRREQTTSEKNNLVWNGFDHPVAFDPDY